MLPEAVMQGMGWQPPPPGVDLGGPPDITPPPGLHPAVLQGLGVAPAPAITAPAPIPAPGAVPQSSPGAPPSTAPSDSPGPITSPDQLPTAAPSGPGPAAVTPKSPPVPPGPAPAAPQRSPALAPSKPLSVEQQMQQNQAALGTAAQEERAAIGAQTQAQLGQAADTLAAEQDYAARARDLQAQAAKQREQANQAHELAQRQVTARMKALDDYKIDQTKFWDDMGVGAKIGFFVGAALSGISNAIAGKADAPNPIMQMLQDRMKQSIQIQMDKRDQMAKGLGYAQDLMHEGDVYQAKKAADIAAAEADATKMLKIQVDLATAKAADPMIRANGLAEGAKLGRQLAIDQQNATEKLANYNIQKQQVAIAGGHLALAKKQFELDVAWKSWQQDREQQQLDLAAAKETLAAQKGIKDEDSKLGVAAPVSDGQGGVQTGFLTDKNGQVHRFRTPEIAQKTTDMVTGAISYTRLVKQMVQGIREHGGESNYLKSDDWQNMKTDLQSATAELHDAYGITAFREPTVKFFEEMAAGGVDPTSFIYNATSALERSAKNLQAKVNEKLSSMGYDGKPISWQPTSAPEAVSPDQKTLTALKDNRSDTRDRIRMQWGDTSAPEASKKIETIKVLGARAAAKDAAAADMLKAVIADESIAAPVRTAAQKALADAVTARQAASYGGADKSFRTPYPMTPISRVADYIPGIVNTINGVPAAPSAP